MVKGKYSVEKRTKVFDSLFFGCSAVACDVEQHAQTAGWVETGSEGGGEEEGEEGRRTRRAGGGTGN